MSHLPVDPDERHYFLERALTDTGYFARNVLGMNTDLDENGNATSEVGKGGIRDHGPHQKMVDWFDDDESEYSVLWAPRYSYKSSAVQAYLLRLMLAHPNIAILLYMHDLTEATERCAKLRNLLLNNEIIKEMKQELGYPDGKGPTWKKDAFVVPWREDGTINSPTLTVASPMKPKTGGRFNIILFDDIVSETAYLTDLGRKKGIHCIQVSLPLRARGTKFKLVGTPYHPGDANHWVVDAGWKALTHLDVGCDIVVKEDRTLDLAGESRWPNLPVPFLRKHLKGGMPYEMFMSQFKLKVVSGMTQAFQRHHFRPESWDENRHRDLTGYLLTDVAPSGSPKGDFNGLAYVGIDDRNHVYLLDLEVGYWKMYEFCRRYTEMLGRWTNRVNHRAELWEDSPSFHSYFQHLLIEGNKKGLKPCVERARRTQGDKSKDERIAGLQVRFQANEFHVVDTVPRAWSNGTEWKALWNPEGYRENPDKPPLPAGDLVEWFVRFPHHQKKDVPDCLALVDATDRKTETRFCYHIKSSARRLSETVQRKKVSGGSKRLRNAGSATRFYERFTRGR